MRTAIACVVSLALVASSTACRPASEPSAPKSPTPAPATTLEGVAEPTAVDPAEPGLRIDPKAMPERMHLIFRSLPRLASGDMDKVGKSIREALSNYTTIVLLETEPDPAAPGRFRRKAHRIGVGKPGKEKDPPGDLILTVDTAKQHGVYLGLFERRVLSAREEELATVKSPGSSPTMAMYDFRSSHLRDGLRVPIVLRYMALVDPATGDVQTAHWILDAYEGAPLQFSGDVLRVLEPNYLLDWPMDIDGEKISFGVPSADAFSVITLPVGADVPVPAEFKTASALVGYTAEAAAKLEQQVRDVLKNRQP